MPNLLCPIARRRLARLAAAALLCPAVSLAAVPRVEDLLKLELEDLIDVRVNVASRFEESALEVGSTVAAVSEAQWQKRGARRLHDAIDNLPGTVIYPNWFGSEQIIVRGYATLNNSAGIATSWDGVPIGPLEGSAQFLRNNINLDVLDRIETIRGPASALYGESAFHGVFAMRSFESPVNLDRVSAEIGSNGYYETGFRHSQALGESGMRLHVTGAYSARADQHLEYNYFEPAGSSSRPFKYQSATAIAKLTSDPNQDLTWRTGYYIDHNNPSGFLSGGTSGSGNTGTDYRDGTGGSNSTFEMGMAAANYKINANTNAELLGYFWTQERRYTRATSLVRDLVAHGGEDDWGVTATIKQTKLFDNTDWSGELAVKRQKMANASRYLTEGATVVANDLLAFSNFARTTRSASLDANTWLGGDTFQVRYGGRVDDYSDFGMHASPRLGLIYHPTNTSAVKLLYGEAFRAPNALEVKGAAAVAPSPGIKPETISTSELRYVRQAGSTLMEIGVYRSIWQNSIVVINTTAVPGYTQQYVNAGQSAARGAEASFTHTAAPWTLELNASFTQSRNDTQQTDYVAFPKWIFNAGVGYRFPQYQTDVFFHNHVMLGMREGEITSTLPGPAWLKNYWRADLNITRHVSKQLVTSLDFRNLFNRKNAIPSIQTNPSPEGIPEEARSVRLALRYTF